MLASNPASPPRPPNPTDDHTPSPDPVRSNGNSDAASQARRSSFNFLRRQKSGENKTAANRSSSGSKMSKKQKARAREELLRQQKAAALQQPPRLPSHSPLPQLNTFGGDDARPDSFAIVSNRIGSHYNPNQFYQAQGRSGTMSPSNYSSSSPVPIPPIPGSSPGSKNGEFVDPYARTESMTHRGRYSYASSAVSTVNSPRRVRRRKDPTPFNVLVIGAKNSGKTSFINFLRTSLQSSSRRQRQHTPSPPRTALPPDSPFTSQYLETEIDHERIGVTLWDSQGLEGKFVDLQLREMAAFLESKFEETFTEEQKVIRAPGVRDTHIHCVFLILDPSRLDANIAATRKTGTSTSKFDSPPRLIGGLDEDLDLQVLRTLQGKTTVIPVISKADTITTAHMTFLKKMVWDSLKKAKLDPLEALNLVDSDDEQSDRLDERDEDEYNHSDDEAESAAKDPDAGMTRLDEDSEHSSERDPEENGSTPPTSPPSAAAATHRRTASAMSSLIKSASDEEIPYIPLSILSPDTYEPGSIGRRFPWGFADPYKAEHCDFVRLKDSVFSEWRAELREASRELWYEGWRTSRLKRRGPPLRPSTGATATQGNSQGSPEMQRSMKGRAGY